MGDILDSLFLWRVTRLSVDFLKYPPVDTFTVTWNPWLKVTGGTTNQNRVLVSAVSA